MSTKDKQLRTLVDEKDSLVKKCETAEDSQTQQEQFEKTAHEREVKERFSRLEEDLAGTKQERDSFKNDELRKLTEQLKGNREDKDEAREGPNISSSATETNTGPENDEKTAKKADESRM